ncbi:hypothetical protein BOX15_Mlig033989g2, partial [Macrostomum lignano]
WEEGEACIKPRAGSGVGFATALGLGWLVRNKSTAAAGLWRTLAQQETPSAAATRPSISTTADFAPMPEQSNDYRVAVFGSAGVGKSSLVQRFIKGTFKEAYTPTVEDTYRQVITNDKQVCTLQITDTTGSHQFPAMMRLSMSKGHAFILVYSVTSRSSLVELNTIVNEIKEIKGPDIAKIPMMLVANKCDEAAREVGKETGAAIANKWGCGFIETSAKENVNVTELFAQLLQMDKERNMALVGDKKKKGKADKKAEKADKKAEKADKTDKTDKTDKAGTSGASAGASGAAGAEAAEGAAGKKCGLM